MKKFIFLTMFFIVLNSINICDISKEPSPTKRNIELYKNILYKDTYKNIHDDTMSINSVNFDNYNPNIISPEEIPNIKQDSYKISFL